MQILRPCLIAAISGSLASASFARPDPPHQLQAANVSQKLTPVNWVKVRRMPDGHLVPTSPVMPYVQPGGHDAPTQNAFDIFQSDSAGAPTGGVACGLPGEGFRLYGGPTFMSSTIVNDFQLDPAAIGQPLDRLDFAWNWGTGLLRPMWVLVEIHDTFNNCTTGLPPAATFIDGIAFQFNDSAGAGAYTNIGLAPDPAAGLLAPADGAGAYVLSFGVFDVTAQTWTPDFTPGTQPFYWGKNSPGQLGVHGPFEWDDDGGPLPAPNISNGIIEATECYDYTGAAPCPAEPLGAMMAFWTEPGTTGACYANCDGSTGTPKLTGNDFTCFINAYATNQSYANCDGSTGTPALTGNDFTCFINAFSLGCT